MSQLDEIPSQKIVVAWIEHENKILFHKRNKNPYLGMIGLVGGAVEKNESADDAIVREISEESGLKVKDLELSGIVEEVHPEKTNFIFVYKVKAEGKIKPNLVEGEIVIFNSSNNRKPENLIPTDDIIYDRLKNSKINYVLIDVNTANSTISASERDFPRKCVLIGNFKQHLPTVTKIAEEFTFHSVEILSPKHGSVINPNDEFIIFDYDPPSFSERDIQQLVLMKMESADFTYLANQDGYIGKSAALEVGYAYARGLKVYTATKIQDIHSEFVTSVATPNQVVDILYNK